ncbi:MAG: DNA polymerase I [Candidatus Sericytochromatia bacterium]
MSNNKYLVVIDGHALAFRAYYALSRAGSRTKEGLPTWAIFGFTKVLIEIIESFKPEYLVMTFDTKEPTFRHEMYPLYKANRGAPEDDFIIQMPYITEVVKAFNIPIYQKGGFEADDIIGTIAKKYENEFKIDVITGDQDLMQIVSDKTSIYLPNKEGAGLKKYEIKDVIEKYGVEPSQIIDFKAIKGDASDNIPGVKGIGEKGATKLIQDFKSLENLYENIDKIDKERTRNLLRESQENAFLSKKLATINTNSPLEFNLEDWHLVKPDETTLKDFLVKLEFRTILEKLPKILANYDNKELDNPDELWFDFTEEEHGEAKLDIDVKIVSNLSELEKLASDLNNKAFFAIDFETTAINTFEAKMVGIAISYQDNELTTIKDFKTFYIPTAHTLINDLELNIPIEKVLEYLKPILENEKIGKVGHNLKYEMNVLRNYNVFLKGIKDDTFIADYVLNPNNNHGLKDCAKKHLSYVMTNIEELIGKGRTAITIDQVEIEKVSKYAGADAAVSLELAFYLRKQLKETESLEVYENIDLPLVSVLSKMEREGIKVNAEHLKTLSIKIQEELTKLETKIHNLAGKEFNINSPKQLSTILFEDLKIEVKGVKKNKVSGYSTDANVLEKLEGEHPIISEILEYRQLTKVKSTYADLIFELINKTTGKIHTSFNQGVAATGRLSSTDPNLQNIPIKTDIGKEIRKAFITSNENNYIVSFDYSQIELRLLAHYTQDPVFVEAFKNDLDIHARTIMDIYGLKDISEVSKDLRRIGKTVNFGIVYGQTAHGLSQSLKITMKEASEIIKKFNERYTSINKYVEDMTYFANANGYVKTLFNRRRYLPEIYSSTRTLREFAKRTAINTPLQGTAADIIKIAMIHIDKALEKETLQSKMLLQVHDELVFEVPKEELDKIKILVPEIMENVFPEITIPLKVSYSYGKNWLFHE